MTQIATGEVVYLGKFGQTGFFCAPIVRCLFAVMRASLRHDWAPEGCHFLVSTNPFRLVVFRGKAWHHTFRECQFGVFF